MPVVDASQRKLFGASLARLASLCATTAALVGCGGGSPLGNPPDIGNQGVIGGTALSFAYFQLCVYPVLTTSIVVPGGTATCAASGCHLSTNSSGGSLKLSGLSVTPAMGHNFTGSADAFRNADPMYQSFYSAQGVADFNSPSRSKLLTKPRVDGTLHGGGLVFASASDRGALIIRYWVSNPVPVGDEFSTSGAVQNMFNPTLVLPTTSDGYNIDTVIPTFDTSTCKTT